MQYRTFELIEILPSLFNGGFKAETPYFSRKEDFSKNINKEFDIADLIRRSHRGNALAKDPVLISHLSREKKGVFMTDTER